MNNKLNHSNNAGIIIREARLKQHLTQEALAERTGVCSRHLMAIENGRRTPSFSLLEKLIYVLNIVPNDIFFQNDYLRHSDKKRSEIIQLLHQCGDYELEVAFATINALLTSDKRL